MASVCLTSKFRVRRCLVVGGWFAVCAAAQTSLYVAPGGSDTAAGTLSAPFATLARARDEIRVRKHAGSDAGAVTVWVRGGVYELAETLRMIAQDSGTAAAPIVYRAYRDEKPVLTGAHRIAGFEPYRGKILKADTAAQGLRGVYFRQLYYRGQRQTLARYPNFDAANPYAGGWAYAGGKPVPMYQDVPGEDKHTVTYQPADMREWQSAEEPEVMIFPRYNWWNNIVRVKAVDRDQRTLTLAGELSYPARAGDRYYLQNTLEELDAPGEWYLDRASGTLYFWPPDGDPHPEVMAPRLRTLLQLERDTAYVTFRGFTFEAFAGTGITLTGTSHCLIAGSVIHNGGDYGGVGVSVNGGSNNGIAGNDISRTGSHGISLSGGDRATLTPADNYADNNYIHHVGVSYKQGVGISLSGVGLRASHNLIHDTPRMAIMFSGNNLLLEYNHMRHTSLETEDTGQVYTGGRDWISSRGTVIRYNYMHDSIGFGQENGKWFSPHFSWGVYLDDNTGGVDVTGNIVARAYRGLIHLHNGRDNRIENNIFIDGRMQQAEFSGWTNTSRMWLDHFPTMVKGYEMVKDQPAWQKMRNIGTSPAQAVLPDGLIMSGNTFRKNIVVAMEPGARLYNSRNLPLDHNEWDANLYWHGGLPLNIALGGKAGTLDFEQWRAKGQDAHSVVADPLFVNAARDDYRLRPQSPAWKLGFQEIPVDRIGPYRDELRATWPIVEVPGERERTAK